MGVVSLLTSFSPKLGSLTIDAAITEMHSMEAEITDYPIESGSTISDHRRILPRRYTMNGVVASSPIGILQVSGVNSPLKVKAGFDALKDLFESEEVFEAVTRLQIYKNMVITSLSVPRDNAQGEAVHFTAELREFITADTVTVQTRASADTVSSPAPTVNQGKKPTKPLSSAQDERSILEQSADALIKAFQ